MMVVFEVHLRPGSDTTSILSAETLQSTQAQIMTPAEAKAVGFQGLPDTADKEVRYIAVAKRDAAWIHRSLELDDRVTGFRAHDVDQ
jgi:hypothetical protein